MRTIADIGKVIVEKLLIDVLNCKRRRRSKKEKEKLKNEKRPRKEKKRKEKKEKKRKEKNIFDSSSLELFG